MSKTKTAILLVEDEAAVSAALSKHLRKQDWIVETAFDCRSAQDFIEKKVFDLILLDIELPDGNGIDLCRKIRSKVKCPIVFLSGIEKPDSINEAIDNGGDYYIPKRTDNIATLNKNRKPSILIANIEAILRREAKNSDKDFILGKLKITREPFKVFLSGKDLDLSVTECSVLLFIAENSKEILTREKISGSVWGEEDDNLDNLSVHIMNIRRKFPDDKDPIITERGIGYRFNLEAVK